MDRSIWERATNIHIMGHHINLLQQCECYIGIVTQRAVPLEQLNQAKEFARSTYKDLVGYSPITVISNVVNSNNQENNIPELLGKLSCIRKILLELINMEAEMVGNCRRAN